MLVKGATVIQKPYFFKSLQLTTNLTWIFLCNPGHTDLVNMDVWIYILSLFRYEQAIDYWRTVMSVMYYLRNGTMKLCLIGYIWVVTPISSNITISLSNIILNKLMPDDEYMNAFVNWIIICSSDGLSPVRRNDITRDLLSIWQNSVKVW